MTRLQTLLVALAAVAAGCGDSPTELARPNAVCLDGAGRVYVSDFHHQRVVGFDLEGRPLGAFGGQGLGEADLWQPWGLKCDADGVFVLNQRIVSTDDSAQLWELKHYRDGGLVSARPLAIPGVDSDNVWFGEVTRLPDGGWVAAHEDGHALVFFDAALVRAKTWKRPVDGPPFEGVSGVKVVGGELFVVEQTQHRVRRLSGDAHQLAMFGSEGRAPGELRFPIALDVCPGEWIAVADYGNYRVQRFSLSGRYLDGFEPKGVAEDRPPQLMDIAVDAKCGALYAADSTGDRVLVTTPAGEVLRTLTKTSP